MSGIKILLCDDSEDDRFFFREALKKVQDKVILSSVKNGEELLEYLKDSADLPDIIFLDLNMPRLNGFEALAEMKKDEKMKNIPVVVFTTTDQSSAIDESYELGATYYAVKPSDLNALGEIIGNAIRKISTRKFQQRTKEEFVLTPISLK